MFRKRINSFASFMLPFLLPLFSQQNKQSTQQLKYIGPRHNEEIKVNVEKDGMLEGKIVCNERLTLILEGKSEKYVTLTEDSTYSFDFVRAGDYYLRVDSPFDYSLKPKELRFSPGEIIKIRKGKTVGIANKKIYAKKIESIVGGRVNFSNNFYSEDYIKKIKMMNPCLIFFNSEGEYRFNISEGKYCSSINKGHYKIKLDINGNEIVFTNTVDITSEISKIDLDLVLPYTNLDFFVDVKQLDNEDGIVGTLLKIDGIKNEIEIEPEDIGKICKREYAKSMGSLSKYKATIQFSNVKPGIYFLEINALVKRGGNCQYIYNNEIVLLPTRFQKLELELSKFDKWWQTSISDVGEIYTLYDQIVNNLKRSYEKIIFEDNPKIGPGGSYIKNLNVDDKSVIIEIYSPKYSLKTNWPNPECPTMKASLSVEGYRKSENLYLFDNIQKWKHLYSDVYVFSTWENWGRPFEIENGDFILKCYPYLSANSGGFNPYYGAKKYFEGVETIANLQLYQKIKGKLLLKKTANNKIEIIKESSDY
ncbi:MAG: hypothetical protein QXK80_02105 [Candidatus Pacearchaeota archaeon]